MCYIEYTKYLSENSTKKIHQMNKKTENEQNLPSKIYLCRRNTLLNKMLIFAEVECKQLQLRGINP